MSESLNARCHSLPPVRASLGRRPSANRLAEPSFGNQNNAPRDRLRGHERNFEALSYLPEQASEFSQAIEQALTALKLQRSQRILGKVIAILLATCCVYAHG